jgi:hypothetical protein
VARAYWIYRLELLVSEVEDSRYREGGVCR